MDTSFRSGTGSGRAQVHLGLHSYNLKNRLVTAPSNGGMLKSENGNGIWRSLAIVLSATTQPVSLHHSHHRGNFLANLLR